MSTDRSRTFAVERRPLPVRSDLEAKVQYGVDVVREERARAQAKARAASVLAILKSEHQAVQEGVYAGLKAMLGKQYAKTASTSKRPSSKDIANAAFKTGRVA